jgi:hypothetical protein
MAGLKSRPADPEGSRKRVEGALRKHDLGEPLTEKETLIVYWVRHGGGCHACGGVNVAVGTP